MYKKLRLCKQNVYVRITNRKIEFNVTVFIEFIYFIFHSI